VNISRTLVAVALDQDRLCAVGASVGTDGVKIKGWAGATMPSGVDARDAAAVGAWIGKELDRAGLPKSRLVFAVPRGEVVLKRLRLPRGEGVGETELAGMVRLQVTKQLTMPVQGTAIDYTPLEQAGGEGGTVAVMAAALPGDRMKWYGAVVAAAGGRIDRLGLSSAGVAALLAGVSQRHTGPVMAVSAGGRAVEFVVVKDGQLDFARSADVGTGEGGDAGLVQRIAVEAKRTWMSYRVGEESAEVDAIVVAGDGALAEEIGRKCGEAMEMPWKVAHAPAGVELPGDMPEADRLMAAPLIGLLAEEASSRATLDFAHPRKAPDLAAARRQRVLMAALGLIIIGGGAYVYGYMRLGDLQSKLRDAEQKGKVLNQQWSAYLKDDARLQHLEEWTRAKVDWVSHLEYLSRQMPDPKQALLDQVSGAMRADVVFTPKDGKYDKEGWGVKQAATFTIQGHSKQRGIANDFRDRLVFSGVFSDSGTKGADTQDQFSFELVTSRPTPLSEKPPPPGAKPTKGGSP
jgi:Tfp pilus assembly PilM family ATPase